MQRNDVILIDIERKAERADDRETGAGEIGAPDVHQVVVAPCSRCGDVGDNGGREARGKRAAPELTHRLQALGGIAQPLDQRVVRVLAPRDRDDPRLDAERARQRRRRISAALQQRGR